MMHDGGPVAARTAAPRSPPSRNTRSFAPTAVVRGSISRCCLIRVAETNSVACGRADGISNVYAAALCGADVAFQLASIGADGVNFTRPALSTPCSRFRLVRSRCSRCIRNAVLLAGRPRRPSRRCDDGHCPRWADMGRFTRRRAARDGGHRDDPHRSRRRAGDAATV